MILMHKSYGEAEVGKGSEQENTIKVFDYT